MSALAAWLLTSASHRFDSHRDGGAEFVGDLEEDPRTMGIPAAPDDIAAAQPMAFEPPPVRSGTAGSAAPMGLGGAHPAPPKAASRQPPASK